MDELDAKYRDVMYFINIRWLSCGKVLNRFNELLPEIIQFVEAEKMDSQLETIKSYAWQHELFFLCDLVNHLNELNLKLQGREKLIFDLVKTVNEFRLKLDLFKNEIEEEDYTCFPTLLKNFDEPGVYNTNRFIEFIDVLISEFDTRFSDFKLHDLAFKFIKNPFDFDSTKIDELSKIFEVKKSHLEFDFALVKGEDQLKTLSCTEMWKRLVSEHSFLVLNDILLKYFCMFGTTYLCESTFSTLLRRKNKYRNMLSQCSLESEIRCELSKNEPDFVKMAKTKECHPSH